MPLTDNGFEIPFAQGKRHQVIAGVLHRFGWSPEIDFAAVEAPFDEAAADAVRAVAGLAEPAILYGIRRGKLATMAGITEDQATELRRYVRGLTYRDLSAEAFVEETLRSHLATYRREWKRKIRDLEHPAEDDGLD